MKLYSLMLMFFSLNAAAYIFAMMINSGIIVGNAETYIPATDFTAQFSLANFAMAGIGAGIAGLIGIITKQYVFATAAAGIWIVGIFVGIAQWFLAGFPMMLSILLGGTGLDWLGALFTAAFTMIFFFSFANTLRGGEMTTG